MDLNTEILVPIWVLQAKVENDYEEWTMFQKPSLVIEDEVYTEELQEDEATRPDFPEYDSTIKAVEILERYGVHFHPATGKWTYG